MDEMEMNTTMEDVQDLNEGEQHDENQNYEPEYSDEDTSSSNAKLIAGAIAGGVALGYGVKKLVDKTKEKIAAKKGGNPNVKTHKKWKIRNPFYRVEETVVTTEVNNPVPSQAPANAEQTATEGEEAK